MRFAPKRSERCVAVATAGFSLTKSKVGVRLDTSLGFLMKLGCVLVHGLRFLPDSWLTTLLKRAGY
jgi:hypothetical protein